jgi:trimeric autotransporter adhesin
LINASTTPPPQLAIYNLSDPFGGGGISSGVSVSPDVAIDRVFYLSNPPGSDTPLVMSFDESRYSFINMLNISGNDPGPNMVRWGQDGLALQAGDSFDDSPGSGQLFLLHGGFVLPEWGTTNPTPSLTSLSPSSMQHGSGNFYLTGTGSNFVPGAVVMWNGSARTTTYVDSQHLKAAIAAADINSPGTATVTVVNPNSAPSGGLTFTIN